MMFYTNVGTTRQLIKNNSKKHDETDGKGMLL